MGVHKLWDLLTATALPVRVESLFGKVCCVDASFWISHCLASESNMRHGGDVIAVFFLRICYLLDKGIKPVFVFDGKSPFAKLKTILKRKFINQKTVTNHKLLAFKMLATQLKNSNKYKMPSTISNDIIDIEDKVDGNYNDDYVDNNVDIDERGYCEDIDISTSVSNNQNQNYHLENNTNYNRLNDILYNIHNVTQYHIQNDLEYNTKNPIQYDIKNDLQYDRKLNTNDDTNLLDLFPEEFLNKSDEEFEEEFQMLKDCDFLSAKTKYDIINSVRDNIIQKDREKFTSLKGKIDEYSDHQIKSYMRDVKINNEIDQLKKELNESYLHLYQPKIDNCYFKNNLSEEIYDYNEYFDKKYSFNRKDNINEQYQKNYLNEDSKYSEVYNNDEEDKYIKYEIDNNKNNITINHDIDESIYATDEMLFGEEMLSGIDGTNVENYKIKIPIDKLMKQEDELEIISKSPDKEMKIIEDKNNKEINIETNIEHKENKDKQMNRSDNDFFLEMYRKYIINRDIMSRDEMKEDEEYVDKNYNIDIVEEDNDNKDDNPDNDNNIYDTLDNYDYYDNNDNINIKPTRHISEHTESEGVVIGQKHQYYEDVQALLDKFGVPYIVSPSEAESQCAYMNMMGDCYAVISDDSDSLVFGAKYLLKNFYNDNVFELYKSDRIEKELGIGREQLALIAIIVGCDYTNGIKGIGIVNALEVIKAYPKFEDLYEFKKWATSDCSIDTATYDECPIRREYKIKHINYRIHWTFSSDFPNKEAYDLFMKPKVSRDYSLKWDKPNKELLIEFMNKKSTLEIKQVIQCLKVLFSKKSQQFIMEDILPEMESKPIKKMSIKNYRINMNANLSAFRNILNNIKNKNKYNLTSNRVHDRNHTLSKIRSKRMIDSIKLIKRRYRKNKYN